MKKTTIIYCCLFLVSLAAGIYWPNYLTGMIMGILVATIVFETIGRRNARQAGDMIDTIVKNRLNQ